MVWRRALLMLGVSSCVGDDLSDLAALLSRPSTQTFQVRDDHGVSMDCLQLFSAAAGAYYGFYHENEPKTANWNIFVAISTDGPVGPWTRQATLVSKTGTMPFVHHDAATGRFILAYESMSSGGNYPRLQFYADETQLLQGKVEYETTLMKRMHVPAAPNTYTTDVSDRIQNVGTPSITSAQYIDGMWIIYVRFHFTTADRPEYDMPGFGVVTYKPSKETQGDYFNWQAFFDNDASNAVEVARSVRGGKIGQRANIQFRGRQFYLYEAQLTSSFDWANWRLFLYDVVEQRAVQVQLEVANVVDFANPGAAVAGYGGLLLTVFVPSEGVGPGSGPGAAAGTLLLCYPALTETRAVTETSASEPAWLT